MPSHVLLFCVNVLVTCMMLSSSSSSSLSSSSFPPCSPSCSCFVCCCSCCYCWVVGSSRILCSHNCCVVAFIAHCFLMSSTMFHKLCMWGIHLVDLYPIFLDVFLIGYGVPYIQFEFPIGRTEMHL